MQMIADNGKLAHMLDAREAEIATLRKEAENFELKKNYYENEIFQIRSKSIKSLAKKEEENAKLERIITNLTNQNINLQKKVDRMPQTLSDVALVRRKQTAL
jgi:hypothetical protein